MQKKLDSNYTRMLRAILNKSWRQHPTKQQLYGHRTPITKTIKIWRTRYAGYCWRSRDEVISDVLLWTPSHGQAKTGRPARNYIQQLSGDTGCSLEDLPEAMDIREVWRERVRNIRADSTTWLYIYIYTSSPCNTDSTMSPDSLSLSLSLSLSNTIPVIHRSWKILLAASSACTKLMHISPF